jgi:hypothetical protein
MEKTSQVIARLATTPRLYMYIYKRSTVTIKQLFCVWYNRTIKRYCTRHCSTPEVHLYKDRPNDIENEGYVNGSIDLV